MFHVDYIRPPDLEEASAFLAEHAGEARVLAGGTDIMVDMRSGESRPRYLVDISRLEALQKIEERDGQLHVGAGATISEILESGVVARLAPALQKAAAAFASRQVRNVATIGGNVAHCSPCGDTVPPLLIHEAVAVVVNVGGRKTIPIEDVASGPYRCALQPDDIITHFVLRPMPEIVRFADFQKIGRRQALAISRLSMAAMARKDDSRAVSFVRFALGSCTPTPHRFQEIEDFLTGKVPTEKVLWEAGRLLAGTMLRITGRRPSAVYKEPAIQGLFMRLMHPLI